MSILTTSHSIYHSNVGVQLRMSTLIFIYFLICLYEDFRWPVAHSISLETSNLPQLLSIGIKNNIFLDLCAVEHLFQV